uniref:Ras-related protein Rab-44 n=1 Tax=Calidris pygmaea TaxID=425635 RepID=A0A8C3KSE2_9CHAR
MGGRELEPHLGTGLIPSPFSALSRVWEMPPAEISILVSPRRASSAEEDPFPEFLKEERFSDQSSLLREMNDAIVALSKQLKPQALGAPPTLADAAHQPQDDAEPQTEPEAATAHGTTPGVLQETFPGHIGHQLVEGDLKEGPVAAELRASDMTQAGASVGAGHHRAQEPGAEQGESPEEARRMLFLQGKGAGVKELVLKVAEHPQGAPGESTEAGEQALMEVEGEGWMQEKARDPGEAEEVALGWGQGLEAGLGPPEAGLAAGWQLVTDELGLAVAPAEHTQPLGTGLGEEEAHPPSGLSKKLEINPGECLEPEPPSPGEARMGAAHGDGVLREVTAAPGPGMLEEEHVGAEVQPQGQTVDAEELQAQAQHGRSSRAGAEEGDVEVLQPQGESARGEAAWGGSVGPEVQVAVPPSDLQEGRVGPDVPPLEDQSSDVNVQRLPEVEADLQPPGEANSLDTEQGGNVVPDVEPLDQVNKPEFVEMEAEDSPKADMELCEGPSLETLQGGEDDAAVQLREEAEDGAQGQGEHELPHEPVLDPQGTGVGQGEGAGAGVQPREEARILDTLGIQSTDANVQLIAEGEELKLTPGGGTETDLQPLSEAGALWTEQGGSVSPDVEPLDQVDKPELVEMEAEDSQADVELSGGPSLETLQGGEDHAAVQLGEEAAIMDTLETQSTDANVQLIAEVEELKLTPGGGTETDLQLSSEASSLGTEQGGSVTRDIEPPDEVDKPELVEMEAEDSQADKELCEGPSIETLEGEGDHAATQLMEEAEDGAQGQGEHELPHEPVLDPQGTGARQGEGAGADVQARGEAGILDMLETQSTDANVQLIAEVEEFKLTPVEGREADLQLSSEASSLDTKQGGSVAPDVQEPDQVNKPAFVEMEAEDSPKADMELHGSAIPENPQGRGDHPAIQLGEEAEDGAQGQDESRLAHEPVLDPHGVTIRQGEGAGADMQPPEEAETLNVLEDQSTDANVQLTAEVEELKLTPGGGTGTDLQPLSETGSRDTEQGGSVAPDVEPLDQVDKPELVEMEAEDSQADVELSGGLSREALWGGQGGTATQLMEEAEDGAQGQDEHELPHEPVFNPQGSGVGQGEGAGADVQLGEEAGILATLEARNADANMQLIAEVEELKSASGGSKEADLAPLGEAGMWEGEQSQTPGSVAGLCAAHTPGAWEGAAGARVSPPAEATLCPEGDAAAEGPGLEAKLGALTGPNGQILGDTQPLELRQGERAVAEGRHLDGAQGVEVVQEERLEAGAKTLVETQNLGLKQGRDDGVSALASPVSKVPVQITTLKLETVMQKDVLIPDVRRLGAPGQAAQSELQEQVSAQADKVRLHAASQQLEEKPPRVMETEQVAARPAEPPNQEVPPVSTPHQQVQQEGAGNDQLEMVLGDRSLGDTANSSLQLQRKLLGEQREDLSVGQQEKQQEAGKKTSQKGEPSPGEPGAGTADGAGAAPRGSAEASLAPDHLYNVLFIGDSHVGKTSFLYRLHANTFNPHLTATVGMDYQIKDIMVDNKHFALRLWDSAGQERYRSITKQFFRKADGVVLMYDITSEYSFSDTRYWLSCIQEGAEDGVIILLLGNKTDCAAERQVPTEEGERLAKEHQLMFYECSAASGHNVAESMVSLVR